MTTPPLNPAPPFVWPDPRVLSGSHTYGAQGPLGPVAARARTLLGVVSDLDATGVAWLTAQLEHQPALRVRLVGIVYPACRTRPDVLQHLLDLQARMAAPDGTAPLTVRVLPTDRQSSTATNTLAIVEDEGRDPLLAVGVSGNLGLGASDRPDLNLVVPATPALFESWRNWFDWVWGVAVPLTAATVAIPALVPAEGSADAAAAWHHYLTACRQARPDYAAPGEARVAVDPESGQVRVHDPNGRPERLPTDDLGIPRPDPIAERIGRIWAMGTLAAVDKASRLPPLDVPLKAEWFGVRSFRQIGAVKRRVEYRVSVLDADTLRQLEAQRTAAGDRLRRMSYPLADGVRWMPTAAQELLETELTRINQEGQAQLRKAVGKNPAAFVAQHRERIAKDTVNMLRDLHPGQELPEAALEKILSAATKRLQDAVDAALLPRLSYSPIAFRPDRGPASLWGSPWGQAATFLHAVAEYPRKALTDPFFWRGLAVERSHLFKAMDVAGDQLWSVAERDRTERRAAEELTVLEEMEPLKLDARRRCELLLTLLDGAGPERVRADMTSERTRPAE